MKIDCQANVSKALLRSLMAFIGKHIPCTQMASLTVRQALSACPRTIQGCAYAKKPNPKEATVSPSLVVLEVGWASYPAVTQLLPETPLVELTDFVEDLVLVLAHEYRHIEQFWKDMTFPTVNAMEIDAERRAIEVLEAFRAARQSLTIPFQQKSIDTATNNLLCFEHGRLAIS